MNKSKGARPRAWHLLLWRFGPSLRAPKGRSNLALEIASKAYGLLAMTIFLPLAFAAPLERPNPDGKLNPGLPIDLQINSPEMDAVLETPQSEIHFSLTNFDSRDGGPHLHYVLDNGPFYEHFDPKSPIVLSSLSEGTHILVIFPVTSWHESWKDKESIAVLRFHVRHKTSETDVDLTAPLLIMNMPQGTVPRWRDKLILFDFVTLNADIAEGDTRFQNHRVRYLLDGRETVLEYHESRYWLDLETGTHLIIVGLTDKKAQLVSNGPWNRVARTFRVE